jgi:hypothetical protein
MPNIPIDRPYLHTGVVSYLLHRTHCTSYRVSTDVKELNILRQYLVYFMILTNKIHVFSGQDP